MVYDDEDIGIFRSIETIKAVVYTTLVISVLILTDLLNDPKWMIGMTAGTFVMFYVYLHIRGAYRVWRRNRQTKPVFDDTLLRAQAAERRLRKP